MQSHLRFTPIYQERVWGGRGLEQNLGRRLPLGKVIGESWDLVDRPEANSVLTDGSETLGNLRQNETQALMGPGWPAGKPFPILVKWLDCQQRLSLQVHPPEAVAETLGGEPKTENWYIAEAEPGAALLAGLNPGVNPESFRRALKEDRLEELVCRLPSVKGDSLFVPSGRLHAIDAGNLILEIQQNSDTTYRVYDWGRVGLDGKPRKLHIEASMKSINFTDTLPELRHPQGKESMLVDSPIFRLRRLEIQPGEILEFPSHEEPRVLSVVEGVLDPGDGMAAIRGDNVLLPFSGSSRWVARRASVALLTDGFNRGG